VSSNDEDEADIGVGNPEDDVDEDDVNQLDAGLSDFDNFSGRDTPIISGRDTPSSHSHEELNNSSARNSQNATATSLVGGGSTLNTSVAGVGNATMNDLASISLLNNMGSVSSNSNTINNTNNNSSVSGANLATANIVGSSIGGNNSNLLNGMLASRGPQLPITVQKANREDINEKFCKFEISKSEA
jgi:hypothetical protein